MKNIKLLLFFIVAMSIVPMRQKASRNSKKTTSSKVEGSNLPNSNGLSDQNVGNFVEHDQIDSSQNNIGQYQNYQNDPNAQDYNQDSTQRPYYDENGNPLYYDDQGNRIYFDQNGNQIYYDEYGNQIYTDDNGNHFSYDTDGNAVYYNNNQQNEQYDQQNQYQNGENQHYQDPGYDVQSQVYNNQNEIIDTQSHQNDQANLNAHNFDYLNEGAMDYSGYHSGKNKISHELIKDNNLYQEIQRPSIAYEPDSPGLIQDVDEDEIPSIPQIVPPSIVVPVSEEERQFVRALEIVNPIFKSLLYEDESEVKVLEELVNLYSSVYVQPNFLESLTQKSPNGDLNKFSFLSLPNALVNILSDAVFFNNNPQLEERYKRLCHPETSISTIRETFAASMERLGKTSCKTLSEKDFSEESTNIGIHIQTVVQEYFNAIKMLYTSKNGDDNVWNIYTLCHWEVPFGQIKANIMAAIEPAIYCFARKNKEEDSSPSYLALPSVFDWYFDDKVNSVKELLETVENKLKAKEDEITIVTALKMSINFSTDDFFKSLTRRNYRSVRAPSGYGQPSTFENLNTVDLRSELLNSADYQTFQEFCSFQADQKLDEWNKFIDGYAQITDLLFNADKFAAQAYVALLFRCNSDDLLSRETIESLFTRINRIFEIKLAGSVESTFAEFVLPHLLSFVKMRLLKDKSLRPQLRDALPFIFNSFVDNYQSTLKFDPTNENRNKEMFGNFLETVNLDFPTPSKAFVEFDKYKSDAFLRISEMDRPMKLDFATFLFLDDRTPINNLSALTHIFEKLFKGKVPLLKILAIAINIDHTPKQTLIAEAFLAANDIQAETDTLLYYSKLIELFGEALTKFPKNSEKEKFGDYFDKFLNTKIEGQHQNDFVKMYYYVWKLDNIANSKMNIKSIAFSETLLANVDSYQKFFERLNPTSFGTFAPFVVRAVKGTNTASFNKIKTVINAIRSLADGKFDSDTFRGTTSQAENRGAFGIANLFGIFKI